MSNTDDDLGYKKIHDKSQGHEITDDELDKIRNKIFDGMYDHMNEKGCSRITEEVMADIKAYTEGQVQEVLNTYVNLHYDGIKAQLKGDK
jgi:hypothetical protein